MTAPSIADLESQEKTLKLKAFTYETAWQLGQFIRQQGQAENLPIAVEVTHGPTQVFLNVLPGASADNITWLKRKRQVALRFNRSSLYMRLLCEQQGVNFNARYGLSLDDFVASGGAVPIVVENVGIVGVATVSGLRDYLDHALVAQAIARLNQAE